MMIKFSSILGSAILISITLVGFVAIAGVASAFAQTVDKTPVAACTGPNGLTQAEITKILDAHNHARTRRNLEPLTWDCKLADLAQEWATRGLLEHRDSMYGENIFIAGSRKVHAVSAVDRWMHEKSFWHNETGTCKSGKVCTHYTQIVWKTTAQLGCGINRQAPGKWKTMLVCNYDPAGNHPGPAY